MRQSWHSSLHGIRVLRSISKVPYRKGLDHLLRDLDTYRGIYLSSGYEYPGRYSRWDIASVQPPLEIVATGREMVFRPLNLRGEMINEILFPILAGHPHWESFDDRGPALTGRLKPLPKLFPEEQRSKQPSAFSILRTLIDEFRPVRDPRLSLVGAFGYDLLFQFDPIQLKLPRAGHEDLHLFLCDDIYFMDRKRERIERYQYDFEKDGRSTLALDRQGETLAPPPAQPPGEITSDHAPGEYMAKVETVRQGMKRGDYYEVVLRQTFRAPYAGQPVGIVPEADGSQPQPLRVLPAVRQRATDRLLARDVRARRGQAGGDLPHLRNRPPDRRPAARRPEHPGAARLPQGRIRADHVYRCGPQRQVARLRAGLRPGDRAPPDRILRRRVPHRGSRGGHAGAGLRLARRVPHAHVVRHHDRRSEEGRRAGHRRPGEGRARLVRRRGRHALAQRRHEHRDPHPHRAPGRTASPPTRWARPCSTTPSRNWRNKRRA